MRVVSLYVYKSFVQTGLCVYIYAQGILYIGYKIYTTGYQSENNAYYDNIILRYNMYIYTCAYGSPSIQLLLYILYHYYAAMYFRWN